MAMAETEDIFFEDLVEGMEAVSPARTVTEADIVNFAGLSGDYNVIHTDAEISANGPFKQRIGHGLLGLSIASGLNSRSPGAEKHRIVAFLGLTWDFRRAIFIGDTVHVVQRLAQKRTTRKPGLGVVHFDCKLVNQRGEICQEGVWKVMYLMRQVEGD